jgi:ATP-dependent Zn protease
MKGLQTVMKVTRAPKLVRGLGQLSRTAYHEAGHAVMAYEFGHATHHVTIVPDREVGSLGHHQSAPFPAWLKPDIEINSRTEKRIEQEILVRLAGMAAEQKFCGRNNWKGAGSDFHSAIDMASYVFGMGKLLDKYMSFMVERARAQMSHPRIWVQVEAVAEALLKRQTLSGKQIREICRDAILAKIEQARRK